jgi:hypothetical protein
MSEWRFKVRPTRYGQEWLAWCAKTDNLGDGPLSVDFGLDCHFEFGSTAEDALSKLKREVLN